MASWEEIQFAEKLFNDLDTNGNGEVDMQELFAGLKTINTEWSTERVEEECNKTMANADTNKDGKISKAEFHAFIVKMNAEGDM